MNEQITALEVFEKGLSKTEISKMANKAIAHVMETGNALQVAEALSAMEAFIKEVKGNDEFKSYTRDEAVKYPKGFVSASGAKIELMESGTKYEYAECGDPVWEMYNQKLESAKEDLKNRETFLKAIPAAGIDHLTKEGELLKIFAPTKTSTSSYKVTLAR